MTRVAVTIEEHPWERLLVRERPHPHAFRRAGQETLTATVTRTRQGATVEAGVEGLVILKSAHSAFSGFRGDRFTTLKDTRNRLFATSVTARWRYASAEADFRISEFQICFAGHKQIDPERVIGDAVKITSK